MDIKEQINKVVDTVKKDPSSLELFKSNPVKAIEKIIGVDLPDDVVNQIVTGVKAKVSLDSASGILGGIKNLFGK